MNLSVFRHGPVRLSRASSWPSRAATVADLSCLRDIPLVACHRHYPGGTDKAQVVHGFTGGGLPLSGRGSTPATNIFEACSTFTHVMARRLAELPCGSPLPSKALNHSLPPDRLRLLPGGQPPSRMGLAPIGSTPPLHGARRKRKR